MVRQLITIWGPWALAIGLAVTGWITQSPQLLIASGFAWVLALLGAVVNHLRAKEADLERLEDFAERQEASLELGRNGGTVLVGSVIPGPRASQPESGASGHYGDADTGTTEDTEDRTEAAR